MNSVQISTTQLRNLKAEIKELKHRNTMMNGALVAKDIVDKHEIEKHLNAKNRLIKLRKLADWQRRFNKSK